MILTTQTVDGVEFPTFPKALEPTGSEDNAFVVGDFSSTILSRRIVVEVRAASNSQEVS